MCADYQEFHDHEEIKPAGQNIKVNYQHESGNEKRLFGHQDFNHQIQELLPLVTGVKKSGNSLHPGQSFSSFPLPQPRSLGLKTKLLHLVFFSLKKSDLFLDFTSVVFICSSCNSLQMFDVGAYVERSLTSPWFGFWLALYPLFLWLIVVLLTTLEMLGLLP